jgi:multicomponent Na+:H+ antiporter subunit E
MRSLREDSPRAAIHLCVVLSGFWLGWSGHLTFSHPLLAVFGLVSVLLVLWLCWRMDLVDDEAVPLHLTARTLPYIPWLAWQVVVSSLDVLRRCITLDVSPTVLTIEGSQRTDVGLVTYANSITLTPGTTSIDSDAERHLITVHAISEENAESLRQGEMDRRVSAVEGAREGEDAPRPGAPGGEL